MIDDIIIYCEGGFRLGLGNIYRSLSLASSIRQKGEKRSVRFLTTSEPYVIQLIKNKGFEVEYLENLSHVETWLLEHKPKLLIIDYLHIDEKFVQSIHEHAIKVVIIGNDSSANNFSDLVVNAIVGTNFVNKVRTDIFGTKYLEGPKYLVLRDEFENRRDSYIYKNTLHTIGLQFGGTDQANLSTKVLANLIESNESLNIILILGAGFKYRESLDEVLLKNKKAKIEILQNVDNVAEILLRMDFLVTSPGTVMFEAFCLGIPAIAFFQNESQMSVFRDFFMTESFNEDDDLLEKIKSIYFDIESFRKGLITYQFGMGKNEIVDNILNI